MTLLCPINLLYGLLALVLYKILSAKLTRWRQNAEATRRGCLPPPTLHSTDLMGTSVLKAAHKAGKEDRGPQFFVEGFDRIGTDVHTIRVPVLDYELIVTRDLENVKAIFSAQASDFDISSIRAGSWMPLLGHGIFTSSGEQWKHSRALVRPQFARDQVADLDLEERHLRLMINALPFRPDGWSDNIDLQPLFYHFSLDITTEFLYGQSVHSQTAALLRAEKGVVRDHEEDDNDFGKNLDSAKVWIDRRGQLGKFYWLLNGKKFRRNCFHIHKHVDRFVQDRLDAVEENSAEDEKNSKYIFLDELAKQTQNPIELRNESLHVLAAGRDTTGSLMGWSFYFLARYPRVYDKLRSIVLNQFGTSSDEIPFLDLKNCTYLHNCINEALRVATVIPLNERVAQRDTTLPRGGGPNGDRPIFMPKGTQVLIPKYAMQHRKDIWGDDVEEYRPERWDERKVGWEFIPFGMGLRQCPGREFGRISVAYVLVRFLQRFDKLENMEPPGPIRLHHAIENRSGSGVKVRLHVAAD